MYMKRLIVLNSLLFFVLLYRFNSSYATENVIVEAKILSSSGPSFGPWTKPSYYQEGFCGNTLVQTPFGYKAIKSLAEGDAVIDCNGQEKKVIAITKDYVNRYIKFIVDGISI